jgi:S-DNA-T family DNA segregation ATPase FtsK/SpoIIIE
MSAISARVAVVPGRNAIGIELPNARARNRLSARMLASQDFER